MKRSQCLSLLLLLNVSFVVQSARAQDTLLIRGWVEVSAVNTSNEKVSFKALIEAAQREGLPDAEKHFRKARTYNVIGAVLGYPGSFLTGWEIGGFLASSTIKNPEVLYLGLGMWGANIILAATVRDPQLRKGVVLYNQAMHQKRIKPTENQIP
jgi:hypothetical protein